MQEVAEITPTATPTRTERNGTDSPQPPQPKLRRAEKRVRMPVVLEEPRAPTPRVDPVKTEVNGLLPQLQRGDREAQELYARLASRPLWRILMARGVDPDRAEELAQDVMSRVLEKVGSITTPNLWGYSRQAAVNAARQEVRMKRARNTHTATEQFGDKNEVPPERQLERVIGSDGTRQVEDEVLRRLRRAEILHAISRLSPGHREVMEMLVRGYRPSEIAQTLNIKPNAVHKRIYDARKNLRNMVGHVVLQK